MPKGSAGCPNSPTTFKAGIEKNTEKTSPGAHPPEGGAFYRVFFPFSASSSSSARFTSRIVDPFSSISFLLFMLPRARESDSGPVPSRPGQLQLGNVEFDPIPVSLLPREAQKTGRQTAGDFLERQIFHLDGKLPQACGQQGQDIHREGRLMRNQTNKRISVEKQKMAFGHCAGVGGKRLPGKNRNRADGVALPDDVQDLLLSIRGKLVNIDDPRDHQIKADAFIAVMENDLPLGVVPGNRYFFDLGKMLIRKSSKKLALDQNIPNFVHPLRLPVKNFFFT